VNAIPLAVDFHRSEFGVTPLVGGKGRNLMALAAAGFPVPVGFVITTEAYSRFVAHAPWLRAAVNALDLANAEHLRDQCRAIREQLAALPLPPEIEQETRDALARVGTSGAHVPIAAWAVRSSSSFEDLAQAAFAGAHDTYLNVTAANVATRVRDCFVSLWGDRAVAYRHHQGFDQHAARMAVVVQAQVACDVAGVGFSIDPVAGRVDRIVIDANYGLGESVVSGEADVDHFEVDKCSLQVVDRRIGAKREAVVATRSGTTSRPTEDARASEPCLTEAQVSRVGDLVRAVETHYGWPQDTEWGLHDDTLYLFQSRPVTAVEPRWTRDESAERFPNPMSPLTWDFISVAFKGSLAHSLSLMGLPPIRSDWFALFDHYVYGNQTAVELLGTFRPLRARSVPELVAELPSLARRYEWVVDLPVIWARDLDRYLVRLGRLSAAPVAELDVPALWDHVVEMLDLASDYFRPNIAISLTQTILHRVLHALVSMVAGPDRVLGVVDGLLAGCETKTALVNREIHGLARLAADTPALHTLLLAAPGRVIAAERRLEAFPAFAARFARFLDDHGHRELDMDYLQPTWSGQPGVVLDSIALILRAGIDEDPATTARDQQARQFDTEHQFLSAVPPDLRFFFRELIRLARAYTTLDDVEHYETTRLNPVARRVACALGERLVACGALDAAEDIFFLRKDQVEAAVVAYPRLDAARVRRLAYDTKRGYDRAWASPPPWTRGTAPAPSLGGQALRGLPGSPGQVTGPCFIVTGPDDFARFPAGAVLIAKTTNPAWTPLFYSASGLVTEAGGPLSHGAVTAREMRLPAVMGVRDVTRRLRNGQIVAVDGTAGTVDPGAD